VEKLLAALPEGAMTKWRQALAVADTTIDAFYEDLIGPETDDRIDSFCRRTFKTVTETRGYRGNDTPVLQLDVWPVQSVTRATMHILAEQVYFDFTADNMQYTRKTDPRGKTICTASDGPHPIVQVMAAEGVLKILPSAFGLQVWQNSPVYPYFNWVSAGGWWENISIELTHGYTAATLPEDIRGAAARIAAAACALEVGTLETAGMISWTVGPETRRWGGGGGGGLDPFGGYLGDGPYSPFRNAMVSMASRVLQRWVRMSVH